MFTSPSDHQAQPSNNRIMQGLKEVISDHHHNNQVRFKVGLFSKSAGTSSLISFKWKVGRHVTCIWLFHFSRAYLGPQYILCNLMGSQIKGQATDDHNGTNVNGRSLLFFRFGIVVQNSFSGFLHKIYEHYIRDDMFLQLSIHFPYILLDNHAYWTV